MSEGLLRIKVASPIVLLRITDFSKTSETMANYNCTLTIFSKNYLFHEYKLDDF